MTDDLETRCPFTAADVELITVDELRVGDLHALGGPLGSERFAARRVERVYYAGYSAFWKCDEYHFVTEGGDWETPYRQPVNIRFYRVRRDARVISR